MNTRILQLIAFVGLLSFSCQKLEMEVPIQVINSDGSLNASYFQDKVSQKLEKRNFLIVNTTSPFKLVIQDLKLISNTKTQTVWNECDGAYQTYTLRDEKLFGWVELMDGKKLLQKWRIEAANYDVLREGNPFLVDLLFPNDDENCTDYFVKTKCKMDNDLRACARQIATEATKLINRLY